LLAAAVINCQHGQMHLALYAHPFDLAALPAFGGFARLRDLGYGELSLAASYHDGRWLMPWHPAGRVRFLADGTVHLRPQADYGRLQPLPSPEAVGSEAGPLAEHAAKAAAAGLAVRAWTIGTHNTRLGLLHPDCCVENAVGDRYAYALCPAQPAVQQYLAGLLSDASAPPGITAIELEAFGWMGYKHSSHHDKASFTIRGLSDLALSLCFCARCMPAMAAAGGDPGQLRRMLQQFLQQQLTEGDAMAPAEPDPSSAQALRAALQPVLQARQGILAAFAPALLARLPAGKQLAVQVHPSAEFTGSQLALSQCHALRPDELVITAYGEALDGIASLLRQYAGSGPPAGARLRLSVWPKAPQFRTDKDLQRLRELAVAHGVSSLGIYHLGLLPWTTLQRVARVLTR